MTVPDAARDAAAKVTDRALAGIDWDAIGLPGTGMLASPRDAAAHAVYNTVRTLRPEDVPDLVAEVRAADPLRARIAANVAKHGPMHRNPTPEQVTKRLAALAEEYGEVARALVEEGPGRLADELLDLAAFAVMWQEAVLDDTTRTDRG